MEQAKIIEQTTKAAIGLLEALGLDWRKDPNLRNTPNRVAKAFVEDLFAGLYSPPPQMTKFPNEDYTGMIAQSNIPIHSMCSHHFLPFIGKAHVAYIPTDYVVGLSKLNRVAEYFARRPQLQERLTTQIHGFLDYALGGNKGVAVIIEASHLCTCVRGVKHEGGIMTTSKISGEFYNKVEVRNELYHIIHGK